ncbi:alpha-amylase family glycosyl hydrolase [Agrilactobacillus fermenti]|uniref:alpha-amylase family glycosyl hydrolase n=1 Tax=Agrilactobacillus fermenti TaxID=2586909 RepID=UPI001E46720C|nr:alpha-amylase family glycosyl hydrolase [Agrilactobacillus fermenti]MCD2255369.1 alpha-amylase [Agrilactobacillus fermenti]
MALDTDIRLRNAVIYSIFVRNHTPAGTLSAAMADLPRIKALGTDIVWLMPIQPTGQVAAKGALGSPYAIRDYRQIDPAIGTFTDLEAFVKRAHDLDMRVLLDVVYNHTAPDSVLAQTHPEWFYRTAAGKMGNRIADWSDVVDLDYRQKVLWDYQIETLKLWRQYVDGFRCDVAPLVPLAFWLKARQVINTANPDTIWLAETNHPEFIKIVRDMGFDAASDSEIYQAFDMTYEYDAIEAFKAALAGNISLAEYARLLERLDITYPKNYVKMRFLENHDNERATSYIHDDTTLINALAFKYFEKGSFLIYAGQEFGAQHLPSLFDSDKIDLSATDAKIDLTQFMQQLSQLKHQPLLRSGAYFVTAENDRVLNVRYEKAEQKLIGFFALRPFVGQLETTLAPGTYRDLLTQRDMVIEQGKVQFEGQPLILQPM